MSDPDVALVDALLLRQVEAALVFSLDLGERRNARLLDRPVLERLFHLGLHLVAREITIDGKFDIGRKKVALVKTFQIGFLDAIDMFVFQLPSVRGLPAID